MNDAYVCTFAREEDRFACAHDAVREAQHLGFSRTAAIEIAVAVAELVSNAVRHAGGGTLVVRRVTTPHIGVEVVVRDRGPGIIARAFEDGFSEGRLLGPDAPRRVGQGLGVGLGAVRRLTDDLRTFPLDVGVVVVARKWLR